MITLLTFIFSLTFNEPSTAVLDQIAGQPESPVTFYTPRALYAWRWDGQNTRLSTKGKKKLDDLRKKIKNNKEIKKYMTNLDFEYYCSKVTAFVDPCKNGRAGDTKSYWTDGKDVCNLPNYCPNVPGL